MLLLHKYTRRMAIANRTCVSFCNQPKAQFGYLRRVTPVCRCLHPFCGWRYLATSRESKAHFGLPWVRHWYNRGKCHMNEKEDAMLVKCIVASIFNRFPVIQPVSSKVRYFSTFLHVLASRGYAPGTIAVNVTWMERGFNAGQTHRSIYLQPFTSYSEIQILVGNCNFSYPLIAFSASVEVFSLEFRENVWSSEN